MSLHRRLLAILLGTFVLAWMAVFASTYITTRHGLEALFDAQLAHDAGVLLALARSGLQPATNAPNHPLNIPLAAHKYRETLAFEVWRNGQPILRSPEVPPVTLPGHDGYARLVIGDQHWLGFTARSDDQRLTVWVGERFAVRRRVNDEIARDVLLPLMLTLPFLALLVGWGVRRGLLPLVRVAEELAQRSPANLEPLTPHGVPAEIGGLIERLNALFMRVHDALEREQSFTSDAAHELRTPLAGIRTHAQVVLRTSDDRQRRHAAEEVIRGVDRATHLVDQALILARLERDTLKDGFCAVDLSSLAAEVIAALDADAAARHMQVRLEADSSVAVSGNPVALAIMIRNLVDNAIRYTPAGGTVIVHVFEQNHAPVLTVTDTGPGIPVSERGRVFARFYRGADGGATGCGLGLSIVKRVADLHDAQIILVTAPGGQGLQVEIVWPESKIPHGS
jgi:two-component system, OmpR family, sensor histidine kinase QseC